jgi:hypothetical protein
VGAEVLRVPLASATLLLALLLLAGHQANATLSMTNGSPDATCVCWTMADISPTRAVQSTTAPAGFSSIVAMPYAPGGPSTFAPVMTGRSSPGATTSPFETISTINRNIVFEHAQPGKLAAASLGWSNNGGTSVYVGTSPTLALRDGSSGGSSTGGYGINPPGNSGSADSIDHDGVSGAAYIPNSESRPLNGSGGRTKLSKSVEASGPVYASSVVGSGTVTTPKPGTQSLVDFGTIELNSAHTLELAIMNLAKGPNSSASDLTIESYAITGTDPESFSVASLNPGTTIPAGGTLLVPITVVGTGPGDLTSNLTIFTNEGTALGGAGETFNYLLDPMVTNGFSSAAPEPASLAVFGVGLAALAGVRRRRAR